MSNFLYEWQTLAGALVGGLVGLLAALVVARDARKREERAAAMLLVANMVAVNAAWTQLEMLLNGGDIRSDQHAQWIADRLLAKRPQLSPLFDSAMFRVMLIDDRLSAHLTLFRTNYISVENHLEELRHAVQDFRATGQWHLSKQTLDARVELLAMEFRRAVNYSGCVRILLEQLILARFPVWYRVRLKLKPTRKQLDCVRLLHSEKSNDTT